MPIVYDENAALFTLIWTGSMFAKGGAATTLGFRKSGDWIPADGEGAAIKLQSEVSSKIMPQMDNGITLAEIRWETEQYSGSTPSTTVGGRSVEGPPSNTALLVSYYASGKGRRYRGRNYWPGLVGEAEVDERGAIVTARRTALATAFGNLFVGLAEQESLATQAIPQSTTPEQKSEPVLPWPAVTTRVVQPVIGTQRRRVRP